MKQLKAKYVYKIVEALPPIEKRKLFNFMIKNLEVSPDLKFSKKLNNLPLITKKEADEYIYKHVFCKVKE